jgi:dCMP deaminase
VADVDKYNWCRASHAEANAIAQAAKHGIAIRGGSLYVTLEPCFVCLKLLATAQIEKVFYEISYESRDAARDAYWREMVADAGIILYQQLIVRPETMAAILPNLQEITSRRRLPPTAALTEPGPEGAWDQE